MRFGAILAFIQVWSNQGWKYELLSIFSELKIPVWEINMDTYFYQIGSILALVQGWLAKVENMHFGRLSRNWVLKVDLGTHLRDKNWSLFLLDLELFWPSFRIGQTKVENMEFFNFLRIEFWKWI